MALRKGGSVVIHKGRSPRQPQVDEAAAQRAADCVVETHRALSEWLRVGMRLPEIDRFVAETHRQLGCKSCFLGYRVRGVPPFPSHACLSVNSCLVHGTAASYTEPLGAGDVLKIDIGVTCHGWIGDAAWTYVFGEPSAEVARLTECGKESIRRGIEVLQPGKHLIEWAKVLQGYVEGECGFHLARGLGGHGIGRSLHAPPYIHNTVPSGANASEIADVMVVVRPGMLLAVEPMIGAGTGKVLQDSGGWPIRMADGSQCVHYEHDVLVTEDGPRVLTAGLEGVKDIIDR